MTDKELLEAAAKAAGYPIPNPVGRYPTSGFKEDGTFYWRSGDDYREERTWNPLKDDGDAFRLQSDLWISVEYVDGGVKANNIWFAIFDGDTAKYSRRAITEAAARMVKK